MADLQRSIFNYQGQGQLGSANNHVVDASNEGIAWAFQPFNADAITHIGFRYGARVGTPPTYSLRLEGLDATGLPNNTDLGGGSATAVTFTPPASTAWDGTWQWIALTNAYTPTRGQLLCATIRYSSGTIDASNNSSFTRGIANHGSLTGFPYALTNSAGTWTKVAQGVTLGWRTANGRYGWIGTAQYNTATANTAGHRSLMKFQLPSGEGTSYRVVGVRGQLKCGAANGSYRLVLLSSSGTELQGITIDADHDANINAIGARQLFFDETTLTDLSYGTDYYVGLEVVSGTVFIGGIVLAEAADRESYPGGLLRCLGTSAGGAITDTTTVMPTLELIIDDITPASGSGSGAIIIGGLGMTGVGNF